MRKFAVAAAVMGFDPMAERGAAPSAQGRKTLRILQWSHFVPRFDEWFDKVYTKEWGARHGTDVVVDHMAPTEVNARRGRWRRPVRRRLSRA